MAASSKSSLISDSECSLIEQIPSNPAHRDWLTFNDLRQKGIFCDVVLNVQDYKFHVHRIVLCACSEYFRALFVGGWKSAEKQEIQIPGVTQEIMSTVINFIYTKQVVITSNNIEDLLPAADQFLVQDLKEKCSRFLLRQLNAENVLGIRRYAKSYFCKDLIEKATIFIVHNFEDISKKSEEFLHSSFHEIHQFITDDRLNVRLEETVCEAVFRWVRYNKPARSCYLPILLQGIRMGLLDPEYFMTNVKSNQLVMERLPECRNIIKEAMKLVCDLQFVDEPTAATSSILRDTTKYPTLMRPRLPSEVLLAIGGWSGGSPTNAIEAYDPRAETWVNVSTINDDTAVGGYREVADIPRAYHGVAYLKSFLYVIGGFDGINYFNTVRKLNVKTYEWTMEPSMFQKRCYISVTVCTKKIYAMGGMNGESRLASAECYDPVKKTWQILPEMNERRSDSSATSLNGKVYIAGGFNGQECLFTAEFFDPTMGNWTRITPMRSRRSGVSIISYHNMVYAVGGFDGVNRLQHAEAYCPETNSWRNVASMNKPRSNFGIEVVDEQIMVVGGYNGRQTSSDVEAYDDVTNEWYEVKEMQICRSALSCCVISELPYDVIKNYCDQRGRPGTNRASNEMMDFEMPSVGTQRSIGEILASSSANSNSAMRIDDDEELD